MKKLLIGIALVAAAASAQAHDPLQARIDRDHCFTYGYCAQVGPIYPQQQYYDPQPYVNGYYNGYGGGVSIGFGNNYGYRPAVPFVQCNVVIQQNVYGSPVVSSLPCR